MVMKKHIKKIQTTILLILFFSLLLTGCGKVNDDSSGSEANWENGQGDLSEQIGSPNSMGDKVFSPPYHYFYDYIEVIDKTEYDMPTSQWFMHDDEGKFGYGLTSGTMETGVEYAIELFAQNNDKVQMDRDVRIQLTTRDQTYKQLELITEDMIHVDTITGEEEIYSNQLPEKENVVYVLSVEILDQQQQVEDTMVSMMYVPTPEMNVKLTTDKDVYQQSDEKATITLENVGPTFLSTGNHYTIEKKVNDSWKVVPLDIDFEDIGNIINPDDTFEQAMEIDQFTPGEYRVIKTFNTDGLDLSATLAAEFIVE